MRFQCEALCSDVAANPRHTLPLLSQQDPEGRHQMRNGSSCVPSCCHSAAVLSQLWTGFLAKSCSCIACNPKPAPCTYSTAAAAAAVVAPVMRDVLFSGKTPVQGPHHLTSTWQQQAVNPRALKAAISLSLHNTPPPPQQHTRWDAYRRSTPLRAGAAAAVKTSKSRSPP